MSFHKKEFIYNVAGLRFFLKSFMWKLHEVQKYLPCANIICTVHVFEVIFLIFSFKNGFQESHESLGEQKPLIFGQMAFRTNPSQNKALVRQSWFPLRRLTTQLYIKPWREGAIRGSEIFQAPGHWKKKTLAEKMIGKHWTQRCWESWESFGKISVPRDRHNWLCGHLYVLTKADLKSGISWSCG